jgi:uroporphyrinogen III methyltransferase / synthase
LLAVSGFVYLVGAGPGDPALLTRRGADLLGRADVVLYDGLVNAVLLDLAPAHCERLYVGKKHSVLGPPRSQQEINELLVQRAQQGQTVVRLKGGDPFVFGRAAEEGQYLAAAGIRFEIVPGVSAATAVPAYAGIPLTARGLASTVAFATGHEAAGKPTESVDWQALAREETVVLFMALLTLEECAERLIKGGRTPETPAAAIHWGTTAAQRTVVGTLASLPGAVKAAGLKPPVLVIIGEVVKLRDTLSWYERRPLFGARVLILRRIEQSRSFAAALAELGAQPLFAPVTQLREPTDLGPLARAIDRLDTYEWVILTSANAVHRFFAELQARELDARALGLARIACVGPVTAAALAEHGVRADLVPHHGDSQAMADALIEAAGGSIREARVLFPRAERGRDDAGETLARAGAEVDLAPLYRTVTVSSDDPTVRYGLRALQQGNVEIATFFAPSQVTALVELLGAEAPQQIRACRLVAAIGNTTRRALQDHGISVDVVPSSPRAEVLASELAAAYKRA